MPRHLKLFQTHAQYVSFTQTSDFIKPNVSYCQNEQDVHYNPFIENRLFITYYVENASYPLNLFYWSQTNRRTAALLFDKIELEGEEISLATFDNDESGSYEVSTTGEHLCVFTLKDPTQIPSYLFSVGTKITHVVLPPAMETIGFSAFCSDDLDAESLAAIEAVTHDGAVSCQAE
jgi:hypothetical protein